MTGKIVRCTVILAVFILVVVNSATAQLLDNDTLYIGNAIGSPGDTVVVSIDIVTSEPYAGWQVPINFGDGDTPLFADSMDFEGSIMTDTTFRPGGWDFIAPFVNNNEWDNVQTCGVAGIVWISPPTQDLPAGSYHIMNLIFFIDDTASAQTILLDTLGSAWYAGGPVNHYIVVIPPGHSRYTHVVRGSVEIVATGVDENQEQGISNAVFTVYPSVVARGSRVCIDYMDSESKYCQIALFNAAGRKISNIYSGNPEIVKIELDHKIKSIPSGIYFIVADTGDKISGRKLIIR
jgi:3D (Asp-Asp-Asp) domain-containing protein